MEGGDRQAEAAWVASDLVERKQPGIAVERGVLAGFGHYRTGCLLEMHRRAQGLGGGQVQAAILGRAGQYAVQEVEDADIGAAPAFARLRQGPLDKPPVLRSGAARRDIGA